MLEPSRRLLKAQLLIGEMTNKMRGYEAGNYPISRTLSPFFVWGGDISTFFCNRGVI